jgi:predicted O-linked N-acetylglucosamine transferase (SPINDLY family)
VAASLLSALGLPELIATTAGEFEALALSLVRDPERLAAVRRKLAAARTNAPLFDTARATRALESAYRIMASGNPPQSFAAASENGTAG